MKQPAFFGPRVRLHTIELASVPEEALSLVPFGVRKRCLRAVDPQIVRRRLAAQAALLLVLASETGCPPDRLELEAGPRGKPALVGGGLHFNLSDSDGLALVATSPDAEVGVDLELVRPVTRWRAVMERVFGHEAVTRLGDLPADRCEEAVIAAWCRYEAWAKARGTGLTAAGPPPRGLDIDPSPDGVLLPPTPESPSGWWLNDLPAPDGFRASCVVAGDERPTITT